MVKSSYSGILDEFGVQKTTLWITLNALLPPLKCYSMKHLWDLIAVIKVTRQRVREVIGITTIKNRIGVPTDLIRDKEA